tara:strand:- start:12582 stop:12917 length:336 start_codon:yes stop_codon:yes gene_type:complete
MAIKITQQTVTAPVRKLNATWTMEQAQTLRMDMVDEVGKILQEEIDAEILAKLYKTDGWYLVPRHGADHWDIDTVKPWLKEHCPSGGYHVWSGGCVFRDREMSVEFELTWT